jgi:prevent-host-death family protein
MSEHTLWITREAGGHRTVQPERPHLFASHALAATHERLNVPPAQSSVYRRSQAIELAPIAQIDDMLPRGTDQLGSLSGGQKIAVGGGHDQRLIRKHNKRKNIVSWSVRLSAVKKVPMVKAKAKLSRLIDEVTRRGVRMTITKHGRPVAVLMSHAQAMSLDATLEIMSDPEFYE